MHARKFGVELVYETAAPGLDEDAHRRLRIELDAIEAERQIGLRGLGRPPRRRRSTAETMDAVRALRAEGFVVATIADKLGVSDAYVKRCLTGENGPANQHGYAAESALNGKDGLAPSQRRLVAVREKA